MVDIGTKIWSAVLDINFVLDSTQTCIIIDHVRESICTLHFSALSLS